ncbi:MAG: SDR family oxidoreductase [Chlamydiota bacterium]
MSWVVVTGGARGLGAALSHRLADGGYSLIIHYNRSKSAAEKLKTTCEKRGVVVKLVHGQFNDRESTEKFINGVLDLNIPITHLVNNVGHYIVDSLLNTSEENWYDLFNINVNAPFLITKGLSDSVIKQKGSILNIGVAGLDTQKSNTYSPAYLITKQALLGMTKSLAKELAQQHVNVNMISPGYLENSFDLPKEISNLPMGRTVELSEVVEMVYFLMSDSGRSITGQNIEIAGGVRI